MDMDLIAMFNKSMNLITRLNKENFIFQTRSFQIWWLNSVSFEKIQASAELKLCLLGPQKTGTWGVNTTIVKKCLRTSH